MKRTGNNSNNKTRNSQRVNRTNVSVSSKRTTAGRRYSSGGYNNSTAGITRNIVDKYGRAESTSQEYAGGSYMYSRSINTAKKTSQERMDSYMSLRYNAGSEAYESAYDHDILPQERQSDTKAVNKKKNRRVREAAPLNLMKAIFTVGVCMFYVLSIVVCIAMNGSYKNELVEARNTLTQLQSDNAELKNEIDDNIDLAKVEKEARKLGMQKPSSFQLRKITVPEESYTVQYGVEETDTEEESLGFADVMERFAGSVKNLVGKILRIE